jgi:hypothetical protein
VIQIASRSSRDSPFRCSTLTCRSGLRSLLSSCTGGGFSLSLIVIVSVLPGRGVRKPLARFYGTGVATTRTASLSPLSANPGSACSIRSRSDRCQARTCPERSQSVCTSAHTTSRRLKSSTDQIPGCSKSSSIFFPIPLRPSMSLHCAARAVTKARATDGTGRCFSTMSWLVNVRP